ncbi:DUF748 domain-containing protein [Marinobacter koreensis]|uniref:DUF748 domain-containing protein n=1 Tax=Marinobacter koreensis TaxID=335974 RepID=A0ABW0RSR6_9GAMM|nr:DUF748 domain-containing protein [Marinobacter koreensis]
MVRSRQRSHLPRNLVIAVLVLVALYAAAGFLLLPWWLKRTLPEQFEQQMGWQATVEDIRSNPFALTLEIRNLSAVDGDDKKVLGFDDLFVNLGFFQFFKGIVGFQEIRLDEPYFRLDLLKGNNVNVARDWQQAHPAPDEPAQPADSSGGPPRLFFEKLAINGGEMLFRDLSGEKPAEFEVRPLSLALNDLATWPQEDGDSNYYLLAALGSQTIEWQGDLTVTPVASSGRLRIADVSYQTLSHFLAPYLPYDLRGGSVTVSSDYQLSVDDSVHLATSNGELSLKDLAVALDASADEPQLLTGQIGVDQIGFNLDAREAKVGKVTVTGLDLGVRRDADGQINWLAPLGQNEDAGQTSTGDASSSGGERPFRWSIAGIDVSGSSIRWRDEVPPEGVDLALEGITLSTSPLTDNLEEPVRYSLKASLASGGNLSLDGQVTPAPFTLEAAVSGSDVSLSAFEPYVRQGANLAIASGDLSLDGNLDLDAQQQPLTGTFSGTADVSNLSVSLPDSQDRLLSWQSLRLAPIEYNVSPARLEIGTVTLVQPVANVVRGTDAVHNVERIPVTAPSPAADNAQSSSETGDSAPGLIFRIGEIQVDNGSVAYTDRTLDPAFTTSLDELNGSVTGISNIPPQQGKVALKGRIGQVGQVDFDGTLGTLGTDDTTEVTLKADNLSLPALSPYFGRYLGYAVDSGKLNLNLDYNIAGPRIDASNKVTMDRLALGRTVASDQAVKAPVKLGLALLRDRKGIIEVDLPISGDLSNPDFSVGQVVMRAFVNLLVKAAASPFSMLGSIADMAGFSGEELGQVGFRPGSIELAEGESKKLAALGDALKQRPDLLLNIRGSVAPEADGLALLRDKLTNGGQKSITEEQWSQAREAYLNGERSLPPEALNNLARDRGLAVRKVLADTQDVPEDQLFLLDPAKDAGVNGSGAVVVPFRLDVR